MWAGFSYSGDMQITVADVLSVRQELAKRGLAPVEALGIPEKLIPVFSSSCRYKGAWGGRGSAKSRTFGLMTAVKGDIFATQGKVGVILCVREFQNSLKDSSFAEVAAAIQSDPYLKTRWEIGKEYIRHVTGRVEYVFRGLRSNTESIKGIARILLAWADEAEQILEASWAVLIPTVREDGSEIYVTWNPSSERSATHLRFRLHANDNMSIVEMNWRDNPYFPQVLEDERRSDLQSRPDDYDHVWEGGFKTNLQGAYYSTLMNAAKEERRIGSVPHDPAIPVRTYWDLGLDDATAIWFVQETGREIHLIEYQEFNQTPLTQVAAEVMGKSYTYADHILPHDVRARDLTTGRSREEVMRSLLGRLTVAPMLSVDDGINAVRVLFPRFWFDEKKCQSGLEALRNYSKRWDDKKLVFDEKPLHNWASHGADAIRYLGVTYKEKLQAQSRDAYSTKRKRGSAWAA